VTVDEHGVDDLSVQFAGIKLVVFLDPVYVVLLKFSPLVWEVAAD
jgi:hypothetical protein